MEQSCDTYVRFGCLVFHSTPPWVSTRHLRSSLTSSPQNTKWKSTGAWWATVRTREQDSYE